MPGCAGRTAEGPGPRPARLNLAGAGLPERGSSPPESGDWLSGVRAQGMPLAATVPGGCGKPQAGALRVPWYAMPGARLRGQAHRRPAAGTADRRAGTGEDDGKGLSLRYSSLPRA